MDIPKTLQKIRENKKITRKEMAEKLFISADTLKDIEYGRIRLTLENFLKICQVLEISPLNIIEAKQDERYVILSQKDINELNRICLKINNQANYINDNHGTININNGENND